MVQQNSPTFFTVSWPVPVCFGVASVAVFISLPLWGWWKWQIIDAFPGVVCHEFFSPYIKEWHHFVWAFGGEAFRKTTMDSGWSFGIGNGNWNEDRRWDWGKSWRGKLYRLKRKTMREAKDVRMIVHLDGLFITHWSGSKYINQTLFGRKFLFSRRRNNNLLLGTKLPADTQDCDNKKILKISKQKQAL